MHLHDAACIMELKRGGGAISFPTNSTGAPSARQRERKEEEERGKNKKRRDTEPGFPESREQGFENLYLGFIFERETRDEILYTPNFLFPFFSPRIDMSLRKRTYVRTWKNRIIRNIEFRISKNFHPSSTNFISSLRLKRAFNYYNEICPRAG